ncbi:class II aldolase/adducin family protein [Nocardia pneumoniae]|uniref:class II aldolase/adducin family protein n=1 Tax=Nocardia pneumoniae TaxID=228601 RepID=UPI00031E669A|nr:class II aldolase/adducin family protein [Nocardia pneumoniae]
MREPRQAVVQAGRALAAAGLGDMVWGHASVRDAEGRGVWMKAAGWGFEEIDDDRVLLVSDEGAVLDGTGKPHLEFPIHTEIIGRRADIGSVVHTHAPALAAFASLDCELRAISHDAVPFTYPQLPRFTDTGALIATPELGRALARRLGGANAILIPNHGAVTVGADSATAVMYAVLLERACRIQLLAAAAGGPKTWSDEAEIRFKRDQVWPRSQLDAGWQYLLRRAE